MRDIAKGRPTQHPTVALTPHILASPRASSYPTPELRVTVNALGVAKKEAHHLEDIDTKANH